MRLSLFTRKLQKVLLLLAYRISSLTHVESDKKMADTNMVPDDVKEGHFPVIAVMGAKPKRFTVKLTYLKNPAFLMLQDWAQEEYGFQQKGVLELPCQPEDLFKILQDGKKL